MVEFAFSFTVFVLLLFGIMEFSRFVQAYVVLAGATREAARYAMVHGSQSGSVATNDAIQAVVRRWCTSLEQSAVEVTTAWEPNNSPGSRVRIRARYAMSPMTRLIAADKLTLSAQSEMVISQ